MTLCRKVSSYSKASCAWTSSLTGLSVVVSIIIVEVAVFSSSDSLHTTGRISFRSTGVVVVAAVSSDSEPGHRNSGNGKIRARDTV